MPDGRFCQQWIWGRLPAQGCASQVSYRVAASFARVPSCVVTMEACWGAASSGTGVRGGGLKAPEYVQPYAGRRRTTTGTRTRAPRRRRSRPADAAPGACAACGRTRLMHQLRAILLERGVTVPPAYAASTASPPLVCPAASGSPAAEGRRSANVSRLHATTHLLTREQARYQRHSRLIRQVRGPDLVPPPRWQDVSEGRSSVVWTRRPTGRSTCRRAPRWLPRTSPPRWRRCPGPRRRLGRRS